MSESTNATGLVCLVKGTELTDHCRARAAHHGKRSEDYREKYKQIQAKRAEATKEADSAIDDEAAAITTSNKFSNNNYRDEMANAENGMRRHAHAAQYFSFLAEHLDAGSTYRLRPDELAEVELVKSKHEWR